MAAATDRLPSADVDFGGLVTAAPLVLHRPQGARAIGAVLRRARDEDRAVGVRGVGHSVAGQSLAPDGWLIQPRPSEAAVRWLDAERAQIDGASSWLDVEAALNARGRSAPVLPDYLGLTVGGTLSSGGYGPRSVRWGAQVDHVESLELALPSGELATVGPDDALFQFALAGLGHMGVITSAVLRTTPQPAFAHFFVYRLRGLTELASALPASLQTQPAPEWLNAAWRDGELTLHVGHPVEGLAALTPTAPARTDGRAPHAVHLEADFARSFHEVALGWKRAHAAARHLWGDVCVDEAGLRPTLEHLQAGLGAGTLNPHLAVLYVLVIGGRSTASLPFEAAAGRGAPRYLIGLYYAVPRDDRSGLSAALEQRAQLLRVALAHGGRPYVYGWHVLDDAQRARLYGAALDRWRALRAELDPTGRYRATSMLTGALPSPR